MAEQKRLVACSTCVHFYPGKAQNPGWCTHSVKHVRVEGHHVCGQHPERLAVVAHLVANLKAQRSGA